MLKRLREDPAYMAQKSKRDKETGERMKSVIRNAGDTYEIAAKKVGVSRSCIATWYSGKSLPRIDRLENFVKAYGVKIDDVVPW